VALGWRGLAAVLLLIFVVRPVAVFVSTWNTNLSWRQRLFIAWIGPRGIVAAAVASIFATELEAHGIEGARALRALVFSTIAATVIVAGLTGGTIAQWLGLRRPRHRGWVLLGANALGRELASVLVENGQDVVCIESNPDACRVAEELGIRIIFGNGLSAPTLLRAELDTRSGVIGITRSDEMNYLFTESARAHERDLATYVAMSSSEAGVTPQMLDASGALLLFGSSCSVDRWSRWLDAGEIERQRWTRTTDDDVEKTDGDLLRDERNAPRMLLPIVLHRRGEATPFGDGATVHVGDEVTLLVVRERAIEAKAWLSERGYRRIDESGARVSGEYHGAS
jgi:hypothetical protein